MPEDPGKSYRERLNEAAGSAIKWVKDKANVQDDIKGFEDYLLNTRSSPDDEAWGNPYFKEDPESPGNIVPSEEDYDGRYGHIYKPNESVPGSSGWSRSYFPPSSRDVAMMDKLKLREFADKAKAWELGDIAKDLNMNPADVGSLPRTALRELVRKYGPSARPYPEDKQLKFQKGWDYDEDWAVEAGEQRPRTPEEARELYLKYRKPKMQEFDHQEKKKAREEWDRNKMKENYAEGLRLNEEADKLEARHKAFRAERD